MSKPYKTKIVLGKRIYRKGPTNATMKKRIKRIGKALSS